MSSRSEERSIPESRVVDKLKQYYSALESAIINEEEEKALNLLIMLRDLPVTLSILKLSGSVKQLRTLKKHVNNRLCEEINKTISVWDQRAMVAAKKGSVLIRIPESKKRNKPTSTLLKPGQESRSTFESSSPNYNRGVASSRTVSALHQVEEHMPEQGQRIKEQDRLWNFLVRIIQWYNI